MAAGSRFHFFDRDVFINCHAIREWWLATLEVSFVKNLYEA